MNIQQMEISADKAASMLGSMANSRRLMTLCHLLEGECSVGLLAQKVGLSQSALSQHLARMRALGLVEARRHRRLGLLLVLFCRRLKKKYSC